MGMMELWYPKENTQDQVTRKNKYFKIIKFNWSFEWRDTWGKPFFSINKHIFHNFYKRKLQFFQFLFFRELNEANQNVYSTGTKYFPFPFCSAPQKKNEMFIKFSVNWWALENKNPPGKFFYFFCFSDTGNLLAMWCNTSMKCVSPDQLRFLSLFNQFSVDYFEI